MVPHHKQSNADWHAFSVTIPSVWNSLADYLGDLALELTILVCALLAQCTKHITDVKTMGCINLLFTKLLIYILT